MIEVKEKRLTGAYIAKNENALYQEMVSLSYARKANSTDEIEPFRNDYNELSPMARFYVAMLPIVEKDWFDWMRPDGFDREQQFFVVKDDNTYYIVDTQGYDYLRYVGVLDNFSPVGEEDDAEMDIIDRGTGITRVTDQDVFESAIANLCVDLSADGFSKKDALVFLQVLLDHKFDCVVDAREYLFTQE